MNEIARDDIACVVEQGLVAVSGQVGQQDRKTIGGSDRDGQARLSRDQGVAFSDTARGSICYTLRHNRQRRMNLF